MAIFKALIGITFEADDDDEAGEILEEELDKIDYRAQLYEVKLEDD